MTMRLTFERDGGLGFFPNLARPLTIDTAQLAPDEAARWQELVAAASLWERAPPGPARAGGDRRTYRLRVEEGTRSRDLELHDPLPAEVRPLVRALEAQAKAR